VASALLAACTTTPEPVEPFHYIAGTHPGDPCAPNGMFVDTPRGYPRLCVKGKWVPLCEIERPSPDLRDLCRAYQDAGVRAASR